MTFFEVDNLYYLAGYVHRIHSVVDSLYGKVALATFPRSNGQDVQMLGQAQYLDSVWIGPVNFETKDSGERAEYDSGMVRDTQAGKARFDLLLPEGVPYTDQFLTRVAELLARGAEKYNDRNWEKASGYAELARFKSSALRHMYQWMAGETDEDHAAAVVFNLLAYETTMWKRDNE